MDLILGLKMGPKLEEWSFKLIGFFFEWGDWGPSIFDGKMMSH